MPQVEESTRPAVVNRHASVALINQATVPRRKPVPSPLRILAAQEWDLGAVPRFDCVGTLQECVRHRLPGTRQERSDTDADRCRNGYDSERAFPLQKLAHVWHLRRPVAFALGVCRATVAPVLSGDSSQVPPKYHFSSTTLISFCPRAFLGLVLFDTPERLPLSPAHYRYSKRLPIASASWIRVTKVFDGGALL